MTFLEEIDPSDKIEYSCIKTARMQMMHETRRNFTKVVPTSEGGIEVSIMPTRECHIGKVICTTSLHITICYLIGLVVVMLISGRNVGLDMQEKTWIPLLLGLITINVILYLVLRKANVETETCSGYMMFVTGMSDL